MRDSYTVKLLLNKWVKKLLRRKLELKKMNLGFYSDRTLEGSKR